MTQSNKVQPASASLPAVTADTFGSVKSRLKSASDIVIVGTGLIVAGGVLLGVAHLHLVGWILLGVGIVLLAVALLSLVLPGLRPVVRFPVHLLRVLLRPVTFVWRSTCHLNPFYWAGSPIRWRGFPGSRDEWHAAVASGDEWRPLYASGVTCACYFTPHVEADVTETVRGLVDSAGRLNFVISNAALGGDPEDGVVKDFCVDYVFNGEKHTATYREGDTVDLHVGR